MVYYIYTLSHPITNEVRYVGKTINVKRRYKQHLYDKRTTHKASWIKSLKAIDLKPVLNIIEECNENNWQEREKFWITQFINLTNHLDGGGAHYVRTTKEETKKKISAIHKNKVLTEETKNKIRAKMKKRPCVVNGVIYESTEAACKALDMWPNSLYRRITSKNFPNYVWLNQN